MWTSSPKREGAKTFSNFYFDLLSLLSLEPLTVRAAPPTTSAAVEITEPATLAALLTAPTAAQALSSEVRVAATRTEVIRMTISPDSGLISLESRWLRKGPEL
jgi:hypothetical protein